MSKKLLDPRQIADRNFQDQIGNRTHHEGTDDGKAADRSQLNNLLDSINAELTPPFRLDASNPVDLTVNIGSGNIFNSENNRNKSNPYIGELYPLFTGGTTVFPSTSGGTITNTPGNNTTLNVTNNNYIKVLIYIDGLGDINTVAGTEDPVEDDATLPTPLPNTIPVGYVTLFNNAGTIDNVEQSKIYQFSGGGSGGGSSSFSSIDIAANTGIDAATANVFYNTITADKDYTVTNLAEGQTIQISIRASGGDFDISFDVNGGLPFAIQNDTFDLTVEDDTIQYYWFTRINDIVHVLEFTNLIENAPPVGVAYNAPTQAFQKTVYSLTIATTGTGGTPTNYAIETGTLPAGLSINSTTGEISGTPTSGSDIGNINFTVRASNALGFQDLPLTINVDVPNEWPLGLDGDLTILNGQTVNLATGVYDYENVLIENGGTLNLANHVVLGCRYDFICSGNIDISDDNNGGTFNVVHPIDGSINFNPGTYNAAGTGGTGGAANGQPGGSPGASSNGFGGGGGGGASPDTEANGASGGTGGSASGAGGTGGSPSNGGGYTVTPGSVGGNAFGSSSGEAASGINGGDGADDTSNGSGGAGGAAGYNSTNGKLTRQAGGGGGGGRGGGRGNHGGRVEIYTHRSIGPDLPSGVGSVFAFGSSGTPRGAGGNGGNASGAGANYGGGGGGRGGGGVGGNGGEIDLRYRVSQSISTNVSAGTSNSGSPANGAGGTGSTANGSAGSGGGAGSNGSVGSVTTELLT